ncbi:MAG: TonB family protein [Acidobacteriota bacterium]|nr:TonB family protein [Acidobacteriota bacterium]
MSYQALLFCPDEKTARVTTQVLEDLEFKVEPCNDPFAAVKKLMAQHFDAIVVDCDNEQNASLLFKTARSSGSNQSSLAVAVVEGQAGVAKAFRIGANLVLTKPINVEQSKGTLRVARGLLRKADSIKAPQSAASVAPATVAPKNNLETALAAAVSATSVPLIASPKPAFGAAAAAAAAETKSVASAEIQADVHKKEHKAMTADSHAGESASAPSSFEAEHIETAEHATSIGKEFPWQPVSKSAAGPMAAALQRAAEAAEKTEAPSPHNPVKGVNKTATLRSSSSSFSSGGAASAAAPAKESKRLETDISSEQKFSASTNSEIKEGPASAIAESYGSISLAATPARDNSLGSPTIFAQSSETPSGSKTPMLIAVALLILAAAGYFGWTKFHSDVPANSTPSSVSSSQPDVSTAPATATLASSSTSKPTPGTTTSVAKAEPPAESSEVNTENVDAATADHITVSPAPAKTKQPMVVKNREAVETATAQPPAPADLLVQSNEKALAGIMSATAVNYPRVSHPETLKISQGVSQGLLMKRVQPTYPQQAIHMRVQGAVQLQASIGQSGDITSVKPLSGDPLLTRAAVDAVKQWKYKPYYLNGDPVSIQTQITVNFRLP